MKTKSFYLFIVLNILFGSFLQAQTSSLYEYFSDGLPSSWEVSGTTSTASLNWKYNSKQGYNEGLGCMNFSLNSNHISVIKTPILTLSVGSNLNFALKNAKGDFAVVVEIIGADENIVLGTDTLERGLVSSDWVLREFSLNAYVGQRIRICFVGIGNKVKDNIYIDNIVVETISLCATPDQVELISVSQNTATIQWVLDTVGGKVVPDLFEIKSVGSGDDLYEKFANRGNFYTLTGLKSNTNYEIELYSDCSSKDKGTAKLFDNFKFKYFLFKF